MMMSEEDFDAKCAAVEREYSVAIEAASKVRDEAIDRAYEILNKVEKAAWREFNLIAEPLQRVWFAKLGAINAEFEDIDE